VYTMQTRLLVSVVDDDESVREALPDLIRLMGFDARAFASAEAFLASDCVERTRCLILDLMMPGMNGRGLALTLKSRHSVIPIIFITADQRDATRLQLSECGASAFLYKPFSDTALSEALFKALNKKTDEEKPCSR
jgi:FixJ family two-component response regulator